MIKSFPARLMMALFMAITIACVGLFGAPTLTFADSNSCLYAIQSAGCSHGLPADEYAALLAKIAANPAPNLPSIGVDGTKVKQYSQPPAHVASSFSGVLVNHPLPFPLAFMVMSTRPSPVPGFDSDPALAVIPRYTRLYLYATVNAGGWDWYLVGPGAWLRRDDVARVIPATRPDGVQGRWVAVDLFQQIFTAYEGDQMVAATLISSGVSTHQTRLGLYNIWGRFVTDDMSGAMGTPDAYSLPSVPFVMFFDGQISLHGTYWHDEFGFPMSHGCVNMSISDAHWLFNWTAAAQSAPVYVWTSRGM